MTFLRRRMIRTPLLLVVVNLAIGSLAGGVVYGYAGPQADLRDRLTSAMANLAYERASMADDAAYLAANQAAYEALLERGLTAPLDRLGAAALFEELRARHGLNAIQYSFSPESERPAGPGRLARLSVRATEVRLEMSGVTDLDLLAFMRSVVGRLPGDVQITRLDLERRDPVDARALARLRRGEAVGLVGGRLGFQWRALHPDPRPAAG
jgi:hypothetical protein